MNSFDLGAIFLPRSGQELSRNVGAVSVYAFLKKLYWRTGPGMIAKMIEIFEKSTSAKLKVNSGGPAGGSALERASPPRNQCTT